MPELPEVETIRRDLEREVVGHRCARVEVTGVRSVRRQPHAEVGRAGGATIEAVDRHGKFLLVRLDAGVTVVVHLGMSGQLRLGTEDEPRPKHTHVAFHLDGGIELRFVDPRTFGEVFVGETGALPELAHLGVDALAGLTWTSDVAALLSQRKRKLKDVLMDQRVIAGIGNIYSDEILWTAKLRYDRRSNTLTRAEVARLHRAIGSVLSAAIEHRGSSLADEQYRDLYGNVGGYAEHHAVFAREGERCGRCSTPVERIKYGGRSHFFCPRCQE